MQSKTTEEPESESEQQASPRAFCHATGFVYQSIGFLLSVSTCCLWSAASCWQDELRSTEAGRFIPEVITDASMHQLWSMVAVVLSFLSGMGLLTIGFGLQHDRPGSGRTGFWLTAVMALFFLAYLGNAFIQFSSVGRIVVGLVMAVLWTVCFLLAGVSARQQKKFPPPKQSEPGWTSRDEDDLRNALSPRSQDKTNP